MGNQPPVSNKASTQNLPDMPSTSSSSQHMPGQYLSSSEDSTKTQSRSKLSSFSSPYDTTQSSNDCDVYTNDKDHINKHVSAKIIGIAANFWNSMITGLSSEDQLVCI